VETEVSKIAMIDSTCAAANQARFEGPQLPSIKRNGPSELLANAQSMADLNKDLGGQPIDQIEVSQEAFAWDREIRIDEKDRVAVSITPPAVEIKRHRTALIVGALSLAAGIGLGWIGGMSSSVVGANSGSLPIKQVNSSAPPPDPAKSDRLQAPSPPTNPIQTTRRTGHANQAPKSDAQNLNLVSGATKQNTTAPGSVPIEGTKIATRPTPVPETRPITIEGWTVREVNSGTATLVGPNGTWKAKRGDSVPGVGTIDSIVRWGNRWIVATSKGLISTQ
jgi:hypothetical protein